jgi:4-amino-4-deoxy-L-arabinose transferase-like glycosyltransferase
MGPALWFAVGFALLVLLHAPLLNLPYYWDEAGYYVPAARDLLLTGTLIPHSVVSNAHPPLVMAYLALIWKIAGYSPVVTRVAMLAPAILALAGGFQLARRIANREVAAASVICTAFYPVFFAQSTTAHVDLAAAGFSFWALLAYVDHRRWRAAIWFSLAALAKETAILIPLALFGWDLLGLLLNRSRIFGKARRLPASLPLLVPAIPLGLWYWFHYARTGFVFGNPEFFRYNVQATLQPLRIVLALGLRLWQLLGYMNLILLTATALIAMWLPPLRDEGGERPRIALDTQFALYAVIASYTLAMAFIGGAVLARYMLPVVPLVIIVCVSTIWRRIWIWRSVLAVVIVGFLAALFINPPYGFAMEDNLAYRDYIVLHQRAEQFVEIHYPHSRVLTAWPASDELTRPYLGYVSRPIQVFRIEDFTVEQLTSAAETRSQWDVALVFSTKYEPAYSWFQRWQAWQEWKSQFFGYHRDLSPVAAARILGGQIIYRAERRGQWVGVIEIPQIEEANAGQQ